MCLSVFLRMIKVSDESCREKQNIHFVFNNFFLENHAVYDIMWKNIVQPDRPQMTIGRMRFACRIHKTTDTHSACVILTAFPLQQWLHERTSVFRYNTLSC